MTEHDFPLSIRGRLFTADDLARIRIIVDRMQSKNRTAISREICAQLNWRQPNGQLKDAACRYVLLALHRNGLIILPPPKGPANRVRPTQPSPQTDPQFPISQPVDQLSKIELLLIDSKQLRRLFREYLDRYHYLRYSVIVGPQLRYLIRSSQGILGCLAFAAAAWSVKARDQWIGWDQTTRKLNLHYIINNVRFLILPWIKSKNLASHVLALSAKQVPQDWNRLYGYRPLLFETFVEKKRFHGTIYKAANWVYVGDTQGRGKNDRFNQYALPIKAVYLYPLAKNTRRLLNKSST